MWSLKFYSLALPKSKLKNCMATKTSLWALISIQRLFFCQNLNLGESETKHKLLQIYLYFKRSEAFIFQGKEFQWIIHILKPSSFSKYILFLAHYILLIYTFVISVCLLRGHMPQHWLGLYWPKANMKWV